MAVAKAKKAATAVEQAQETRIQERILSVHSEMYNRYEVKLQFTGRIYGGLPKNEEVVEGYVRAKFSSDDSSLVQEDLDLVEECDKMTTGFKTDPTRGDLYIGTYQVKAALKQYASLLKFTVQKRGSKQTTKEAMFVKGVLDGKLTDERIFFQPVTKQPHGLQDFIGHVNGPQGQRSFLRTAEYMEQAVIQFQVWASQKRMSSAKELTEDDLFEMLVFGQECGMGSCRSFEAGKYLILDFKAL